MQQYTLIIDGAGERGGKRAFISEDKEALTAYARQQYRRTYLSWVIIPLEPFPGTPSWEDLAEGIRQHAR